MSKRSLQEKLYDLSGFQREYTPLHIKSIVEQFEVLNLLVNKHVQKEIDLGYMLLCGSILAQSTNGKHLDCAFRIAQYCMNSSTTNEAQRRAAAVIFDTMTNSTAINLAVERGSISEAFKEDIPFPLQLQMIQRGIQYSLYNDDSDRLLPINKFQLDVVEERKLRIGSVFQHQHLLESLLFYYKY
jgi:hypothetical protein